MAKKSYAEKLKDPRWQKKRLEIMERDNFTCLMCKSTAQTLNVHHGFYKKNTDPWDYPNETLHTICEECHDWAESGRSEMHLALAKLRPDIVAAFGNAVSGYPIEPLGTVMRSLVFILNNAVVMEDWPDGADMDSGLWWFSNRSQQAALCNAYTKGWQDREEHDGKAVAHS